MPDTEAVDARQESHGPRNRRKRVEGTFYHQTVMIDAIEGMTDLHVAPGLVEEFGPVLAVVLSLLLLEEYLAAYEDTMAADRSFSISLEKIAEESKLSVDEVVRCMAQLSTMSAADPSEVRHGFFDVNERGPATWRIATRDEKLTALTSWVTEACEG